MSISDSVHVEVIPSTYPTNVNIFKKLKCPIPIPYGYERTPVPNHVLKEFYDPEVYEVFAENLMYFLHNKYRFENITSTLVDTIKYEVKNFWNRYYYANVVKHSCERMPEFTVSCKNSLVFIDWVNHE